MKYFEMKERIEDANYDDLSLEEFFYIYGQMVRYLIRQSEASQKHGDMLGALSENIFYMKRERSRLCLI